MGKYYFVVYKCEHTGWPENGAPYTNEHTCQDVTHLHPIQFQHDCNVKYGKRQPCSIGGGHFRETYMVTFYHELTHEEYKRYKGTVG